MSYGCCKVYIYCRPTLSLSLSSYFKKGFFLLLLLWIIKESNGSNPLLHPLYSTRRIHHQWAKHSRENHKGKISVKAFVSFEIKKKKPQRETKSSTGSSGQKRKDEQWHGATPSYIAGVSLFLVIKLVKTKFFLFFLDFPIFVGHFFLCIL
jgi:hypothetical protein